MRDAAYGLAGMGGSKLFEACKCASLHIMNALTSAFDTVVGIERLVEAPGFGKLALYFWPGIALEDSHRSLAKSGIREDISWGIAMKELRCA